MAEDKLSVIIARYPCRLVERSVRQAPVFEPEKCKKCYLCLALNCPAISKTVDGSIIINPAFCSGCNLCAEVCVPQALRKR
jgi:indolepyruvate ferredoxin oxidoreductase alpha subunit